MTTTSTNEASRDPRVARYKELKGYPQLYLDTVLPGYTRTVFPVIGHAVSQAEIVPPITAVDQFHVAILRCPPGNGAALHDHETTETFMPLSSRWMVCWGDAGENEVVLEQYDTVSVPPGVMRGFKNIGDEEGEIFGIVAGNNPGRVIWPPEIETQARERGYALDDKGHIVKTGVPLMGSSSAE